MNIEDLITNVRQVYPRMNISVSIFVPADGHRNYRLLCHSLKQSFQLFGDLEDLIGQWDRLRSTFVYIE